VIIIRSRRDFLVEKKAKTIVERSHDLNQIPGEHCNYWSFDQEIWPWSDYLWSCLGTRL